MSDLTDLQQIKSNLITRIKEVTSEKKPSYDIEGQQVSWNEYLDTLMKQLGKINALIMGEQGPYEEATQAFSGD